MRRRALVGLPAIVWALRSGTGFSQSRDGLRRIGVLMPNSADDPSIRPRADALVEGLAARGWHEGRNIRIDWRWAVGEPALFDRYAAELISLGPEVLVGGGSIATKRLQAHTSSLPIVFVHVTDPEGQRFVASIVHPGGNITGFTIYDPPMAGKWLEVLIQVTPRVDMAAVLFNPATAPYAALYLNVLREIAPTSAVAVEAAPCHDDAEIEAAVAHLAQSRGGLIVIPNAFSDLHRDTMIELTARYHQPAVYPDRHFTAAGGLMSYGVEPSDLYRRAADYIDRILKGERPGDLPVQNPTRFETVINLKTAKALGVTVSPALLRAADELIE